MTTFRKNLFIVALAMSIVVLLVTIAEAKVIVQEKKCYRIWSSKDTITMTMSDRAFENWKKRNDDIIHRRDIRFAYVETNERFSQYKEYKWVNYKGCK